MTFMNLKTISYEFSVTCGSLVQKPQPLNLIQQM